MNATPYSETGYLKARVFTALGAVPIEGASVKISPSDTDSPRISHDLLTNRSGETETVALPAPPRRLSTEPGYSHPYSAYRIEAYAKGFAPYAADGVPVFSGILSVQPIALIPMGERDPVPPSPPIDESEPSDLEPRGTGGEAPNA